MIRSRLSLLACAGLLTLGTMVAGSDTWYSDPQGELARACVVPTEQRQVVYYYTAPFDCEPCRRLEADIGPGVDGIQFVKAQDDAWLAAQNGYPQLRWSTGSYSGWSDLAQFLEAYRSTLGSKSQHTQSRLAANEAAHTPTAEVVRVLNLLPKPQIAFVDFGCGYDARWCIAAAEKWGCKCVGIEIDPDRATAALDRVKNLGLDHLITIVEGDATEVQVSGDVGVAYLYSDALNKVAWRTRNYKAFVSYLHAPAGLPYVKNGDTWFYTPTLKRVSAPQQSQQSSGAVWGGAYYNQRVCNNPNCAMCNSIQRQLNRR